MVCKIYNTQVGKINPVYKKLIYVNQTLANRYIDRGYFVTIIFLDYVGFGYTAHENLK